MIAEKMAVVRTSADYDWRERLATAVARVAAASDGFEASGDVAVVLSGGVERLALTLESLFERVVRPSRARVFACLSGGATVPEETRAALRALPFIADVAFADAEADALRVKEDHSKHVPYPARRAREPEPHANLLWMWKGVADANALREEREAADGRPHRVVARVRTDLEFDRDHDLAALQPERFAVYAPRCGNALDGSQLHFATFPPEVGGVNDQFFLAAPDTFGRLARMYDMIPRFYENGATFHPEFLFGYAAGVAMNLRIEAYAAPPTQNAPAAVPGFATATGSPIDPCDFAAAGYQIRRHSGRPDAFLGGATNEREFRLMERFGSLCSDDELRAVVAAADRDGDGLVDRDEFDALLVLNAPHYPGADFGHAGAGCGHALWRAAAVGGLGG